MSLYAELRDGEPLLDDDEASRYCQPTHYDRDRHEPKIGAFQRKASQADVSINRLQYFQLSDRLNAIDCIRQEFLADNYDLKKNGGFVVFNVGAAKAAALAIGHKLVFKYTPHPPIYSHSSIFMFPEDPREGRVVATAIKRLITKADTYPAIV